jgi:hypothetical protein
VGPVSAPLLVSVGPLASWDIDTPLPGSSVRPGTTAAGGGTTAAGGGTNSRAGVAAALRPAELLLEPQLDPTSNGGGGGSGGGGAGWGGGSGPGPKPGIPWLPEGLPDRGLSRQYRR